MNEFGVNSINSSIIMTVKLAKGIKLSNLKKELKDNYFKIYKDAVKMMRCSNNKNLYIIAHTIGHEAI